MSVCLNLYIPCVFRCLQGAEEGIQLLGAGVTDRCEAQYGGWKLNPGFSLRVMSVLNCLAIASIPEGF